MLVSRHLSLLSFVKEPGRHLLCSSTNADVSYTKCIIMKVVHFNFRRFFSCFSILFNFIKRILFRSRQRKSSRSEDDVLPTLVTVASDPQVNYDQPDHEADEWEDWSKMEEFSVKVEPAVSCSPEPTPPDDEDLFQDMAPVFQKPKKIVVKKKKSFSDESSQLQTAGPSNRLKFDISYPPVEPELGSWTEESNTAWDEEGVSEKEIEWQTEKLAKERKQAERERRALEQQKRKEERQSHRADNKKQHGHLGVRLST